VPNLLAESCRDTSPIRCLGRDARRQEETQIPSRQAEETITAASEWLRIAIAQFLSSETSALMGIKDGGEFRAYFVTRFKGILDLTVRNSLSTQSPIPDWASKRIKEAWNVQEPVAADSGMPGP
jgi:hypothetical protein